MARTVRELMEICKDYPAAIYASGILYQHSLDPAIGENGQPLSETELRHAADNTGLGRTHEVWIDDQGELFEVKI